MEASATTNIPNTDPKSQGKTKESIHEFFARVPLTVKLLLVGLMVAMIVTVALGIWAVVKVATLHSEPELPEAVLTRHPHVSGPPAAFAYSYEIKDFSVHFSSQESDRVGYAQFGLTLDMPSPEAVRTMELHRAKILDLIFEVAADFSLETMKTPEGYQAFKGALLKRFEAAFAQDSPRDLALKNWLLH